MLKGKLILIFIEGAWNGGKGRNGSDSRPRQPSGLQSPRRRLGESTASIRETNFSANCERTRDHWNVQIEEDEPSEGGFRPEQNSGQDILLVW